MGKKKSIDGLDFVRPPMLEMKKWMKQVIIKNMK